MIVLDRCPKNAARYLTKKHIRLHILELQNLFYEFQTHDPRLDPGKYQKSLQFICLNIKNFKWTVDFYNELQELWKNHISAKKEYFKNIETFNESMLSIPNSLPDGELTFITPRSFKVTTERKKSYRKDQSLLIEDVIDFHRKKYILNSYKGNEFIQGMPEWYSSNNVNLIYSSYSFFDKVQVKVYLDGENGYSYFYSTGNSLWTEIDASEEMKYIINSFIFPHPKHVDGIKVSKPNKSTSLLNNSDWKFF